MKLQRNQHSGPIPLSNRKKLRTGKSLSMHVRRPLSVVRKKLLCRQMWKIECEAMLAYARRLQQLAFLCAIALATAGAAAAQPQVQDPVALQGCNDTCGNMTILYPFGIGKSNTTGEKCFLNQSFELTCQDSELILGSNIRILNISLQGQLEVSSYVSSVCYDEFGTETEPSNEPYLWLRTHTISSEKNKFYSVGCDTYGYLNNFRNGQNYSTGCITRCGTIPDTENSNTCSGIGCCEVKIPQGMKNITIEAFSFKDRALGFNNCSYSFVHKLDENGEGYRFDKDHLRRLPFEQPRMVLDWVVVNETCKVAGDSFCINKNSHCNDTPHGFRCVCDSGYYGNPYLPEDCKDRDECNSSNPCLSNQVCVNTNGSYTCACKKGYKEEGDSCQKILQEDPLIKVVIVAGVGFIALVVGLSTTYLVYKKRKLIKLKEKFFRQNGGFILQQRLFSREDSSRSTTQIFTAEELKKATKNYDDSLIIGKGGYGTVFKGFLTDNRIVAIKKSKLVDQSQIEQFINEVVVLSQINHRNVVKLLGCCLETEVPLLVYEFVNNGTLFDYIHNENKVSWRTRLQIATEAAGALSYLHSAASIPIIHRDVKTANILLDETYIAKVADFGASRLVPMDHAEIATVVQGTLGYLDPEYMQTSQLTEKSDVYSFGVVLVELLTGEKVVSFDRPEEKRSLAMHFLSSFKENCLFEVIESGIVKEENKEEVMEVAVLASKCLRLIGEERPTMKEVAMELEGIRMMNKHAWGSSNVELNLEETEHLLQEESRIHERGESSTHQNSGYDSIKDHVLVAFDVDGR